MNENLSGRYGEWAMVAGASEGIGAEFAKQLADHGFNLVLIARRESELAKKKAGLEKIVKVRTIAVDLSLKESISGIINQTLDLEIGLFVYNAVFPLIGHFIDQPIEKHHELIQVNISTPMTLVHHFGNIMARRGKGAIILMSSMAGQQGSAMVAHYAASKAYNTVLAEGLWYELKKRNVDVMAVIAGATSTPNYVNSKPEKTSMGTPAPLNPAAVVKEALARIGRNPSFITGRVNRIASWFMKMFFSRKKAIEIISKSTTEMYPHYLSKKKDPD
jgi:hypothetical protein